MTDSIFYAMQDLRYNAFVMPMLISGTHARGQLKPIESGGADNTAFGQLAFRFFPFGRLNDLEFIEIHFVG